MVYKLFITCIIILALVYYLSIIMQSLFPKEFKITDREITFIKAAIPFYYWIASDKKRKQDNNQNRQDNNQNRQDNETR